MTAEQIKALNYQQSTAWWSTYVQNAVLLNQNLTYNPYDLSGLADQIGGGVIKTNSTSGSAIEQYVRQRVQSELNAIAMRINAQREADFKRQNPLSDFPDKDRLSFTEGVDYEIVGANGQSVDDIDWASVAVADGQPHNLQVTVEAILPYNHMTGQATLTVSNSDQYVNLTDLSSIVIPDLTNQRTASYDTLKKNLYAYIEKYAGDSADWHITNAAGEDEQTVIQNLLLTDGATRKEGDVLVVANADSTRLQGDASFNVVNSITNPVDLADADIPQLNINTTDPATA